MQITRTTFAVAVGAVLTAGGLGAVAVSSSSTAAAPATLNVAPVDHHQDSSPLNCPRSFPAATLTVTSNGTPYAVLACAKKQPVSATTTVTQTATVTVTVTTRPGSTTSSTTTHTTTKQDPPSTSTSKPDPPSSSN